MIQNKISSLESPADRPFGVRSRCAAGWAWLRDRYAVYRQRRALLGLNDAMLKDLGISYIDALQEGSKPFWRT
ncbi:MAG: DUF1127 domain-containing protein [Gammaproteobacteria bacterium]|nr:DUF1127 domain-containing protein [Gammaproteobacteria bacterium]